MSELEPITREEMFLAAAGGQSVELPEPITREEVFLKAIADGGGGGGGGSVTDVQVNGQSVVSGGVATIPLASPNAPGVVVAGSVSVTGSTPAITALPGIRYICGEVSTLDITLPASGCVDVVFESGSTPTVLTVTPPTGQTVKWAGGFDPTSLEAGTTYEINIADGLGVAGSWT